MRRSLLAAILFLSVAIHAQTISYFNQGFLRQPDAATDRAYLGIVGGSGTNYIPGANITFLQTGPYTYKISSTGGGGSGLTTNFAVGFANTGQTNTLYFTNGLLVAVLPYGSSHGYSIILPGGGYLLQPNGGTLLLP